MKDVVAPVQSTGTINSQDAVECDIDAEGAGVLMSILSNMYSNKFLACLREYVCNAWDSHVEAGKPDVPVRVTLPTVLQPTLLIQDEGTGLSEDEVIRVYKTYCRSTKRETNGQVGAFGIGSKSAFTMGQQFVVTAVKDGRKVVALFALNERNIGTVNILRRSETEEPNGVLISLAVEDVQAMREEADRFFSFSDPGRVLVDGKQPVSVLERATRINDRTFLVPEHEGEVIVVMGQVPYVVPAAVLRKVARELDGTAAGPQAEALTNWYHSASILFRVQIGDVSIAPNRETLRDTALTISTLKALVSSMVEDMTASVRAKVDAASNPFEANRVLTKALADLQPFKLLRSEFRFNGVALTESVTVHLPTLSLARKSWNSNVEVVARTDSGFEVNVDNVRTVVVVTGIPEADQGKVQRYAKRFLDWYRHGEEETRYLMISDKAEGEHGWFTYGTDDGARTMTLDEYRAALRALRDSDPRTKNEPSYTTGFNRASRDPDDRDLLTDIISWGKDIVITGDDQVRTLSRDPLARKALEDYTLVVLLGTQSRDALVKRIEDDGSVQVVKRSVSEIVSHYAAGAVETMTKDEVQALAAQQWLGENSQVAEDWNTLAEVLGEENISSKAFTEIREAVALATLVAEDVPAERRNLLANALSRTNGKLPEYDAALSDISDRFPLLSVLMSTCRYTLERRCRTFPGLKQDILNYLNTQAA